MKKIYLFLFASVFTLSSFSQTSFRIGVGAAYASSNVSPGGELVAYGTNKATGLVIGAGVNILDLKNIGLYVPTFMTLGYHIDGEKRLLVHVDPGYSVYSKSTDINSTTTLRMQGGWYIGSGVSYNFFKNAYVNVQYSLYQLRGKVGDEKTAVGNSHGVFATIGYTISE